MRYNIASLERWWGERTLADVTAHNCKAYAKTKTQSAARSDLEKLGAAIKFWHKNVHPLAVVPPVWLPPRNPARERWMTRAEVARLLWAARRCEHLKRFILIGLYSGSRLSAITSLQWSWINFESRVMLRRPPGSAEVENKRQPPLRIHRKLRHFLRRWHKADAGRVTHVVHYDGRRLLRDPHSAWDRACERAGLVGELRVTPHTLRHTRGTWLMQSGKVTLWEAAASLGMTTRILESTYGHHHPNWQQNASEV